MENNESTQSKYDAALAKYNTNLNDAEVAAEVAGIIAEKVPANNTPEVKKFLFNCIDLTTLNSTDSDESVMKFTQKVNQFDEEFPDLKNVAAICVYPNFAARVTTLCNCCLDNLDIFKWLVCVVNTNLSHVVNNIHTFDNVTEYSVALV